MTTFTLTIVKSVSDFGNFFPFLFVPLLGVKLEGGFEINAGVIRKLKAHLDLAVGAQMTRQSHQEPFPKWTRYITLISKRRKYLDYFFEKQVKQSSDIRYVLACTQTHY